MSEIKYLLGYDEIAFKGMTNILTQCTTKKKSQELQNKVKSALKLQELVKERIKEDVENCCCLNKRSCTWCHDRKIQEFLIEESK